VENIYVSIACQTAADAQFDTFRSACTTSCSDDSIVAKPFRSCGCRPYLTGPAAVSSLLPSCTLLHYLNCAGRP
jgi:hypothetical protein